MPRPQRCRRICCPPRFDSFSPDPEREDSCFHDDGSVILTLDEYEVIRLVDLEKKSHEQCAAQMDISRSTATEIYESARTKIAQCIVYGKRLLISGGNYRVCQGQETNCCTPCWRQKQSTQTSIQKGVDFTMKIAVTYENGKIFQHFGHTSQFKIYDTENGQITSSEVVDTNGSGHGALAGFLRQYGVDTLICGGIGGGAQNALSQAGIQLYGGVSGDADEAVLALLAGTLGYNPNVHCSHHGHGEGEHSCGGHGHGESGHSCGNHDHHSEEGHSCGNHGCR